jgi:hypothetical protein
LDPWIWDPGWVKIQDLGSGSGKNNPDHISESFNNFFLVKILKFFDVDHGSGIGIIWIQDLGWQKFGSGMEKSDRGWKKIGSGIWDKHSGSATLQHNTNNVRMEGQHFPNCL